MAKSNKDYFGLSYLVSLIFTIIWPIGWICGIITRFQEGKIVAGILRIIPGVCWIIWIADIVCMVLNRRILRLLNV